KDDEKHPTIQMFWEVFDELTEKERNQEERLSEDQYFPQSHTCFTALELPQYSSKELMKMRLSEASVTHVLNFFPF
uniref:HECT domain-containing protein n=1 Tax=Periophthalmus magnuspinnatus TaxID=409849 RepID=A0A3B4A668_9GOBI